jgi:hypothetical protein
LFIAIVAIADAMFCFVGYRCYDLVLVAFLPLLEGLRCIRIIKCPADVYQIGMFLSLVYTLLDRQRGRFGLGFMGAACWKAF